MKNKALFFICWVSALLLNLTSCTKDTDGTIKELVLEENEVWLKSGESAQIMILNGNQGYTVSSSNKDLLVSSIEGDQINLQAYPLKGDAEVIIYVSDAKQMRTQLNVFISSYAAFKVDKEHLTLAQVQAKDSITITGGQGPFAVEINKPELIDIDMIQNKLHLKAKRRGEAIIKIKDRRGSSSEVNVVIGGERQSLNFGDQLFAHTNFNAIAVVDKSIQNLKQVTFELSCRIQGYRGLQTFMGLEGQLIVRGKHDDYRTTHPIEIAGLGDRIMLESTSSFQLGEWIHMALVVDCDQQELDKKYKLYINGIEDPLIVHRDQETHSHIDLTRSGDGNRFVIGRAFGQDWRVIRGEVYEGRIWTTARSATQIQDNQCAISENDKEGLLAHWDFSSADDTDYIQDINGGKYESNLILSDARRNGSYVPSIITKNRFANTICPF